MRLGMRLNKNSEVCGVCGVIVSGLGRHKRRKRCKVQHIREK